jgi:hypothetical protein
MALYDNDLFAGLGILAIAGISILVAIAINVLICYLLQRCYDRIPPQFRKQQPGMVWLLLIPCFHIVWNFFVFPPLSKSFKAYFDSIDRTDVGDCQESIGLAYSVCAAVSIIPYVGCLTGIASLVLLIIYLIKTNDLKNQIPEA